MNYSTEVKQKLLSIITKMDSYYWLFTKHPKTDFSRKKKWSFEEVMKFMLTMEGKALRDELLEYFEFDNTTPSNSSFNQRRAQILPEAFEFLFQEFTKSFTDNVTYNGLRLIACDGSDLCIAHNPQDETTYFQTLPDRKGYNLLHLNAFYDLCSRQYTDAIIQPSRLANERRAMCEMIDRYNDTSAILIADFSVVSIVIAAATGILSLILSCYFMLTYHFIGYITLDHPELKCLEVFKECRLLMHGNRLRLLYILLSFIGYGLLVLCSFGIASLWVVPYQTETLVIFYLDCTDELNRIPVRSYEKTATTQF
jgi:hypothetical protein